MGDKTCIYCGKGNARITVESCGMKARCHVRCFMDEVARRRRNVVRSGGTR